MKAYEGYKEINIPWLKQIPNHWKLLRNRDIFTERSEVVGDSFAEYTLLSLTTGGVIPRDVESGKGKFPSDFKSYKVIQEGDIAFCLFDIDETPRTVGLAKEKGMLTGAYTIFHVKDILPEFVTYYYIAVDDVKALRYHYTGLRKTVKTNIFLSEKMPVPPADEQKKIVEYLNWQTSKMNKLISTKRKELKVVKEAKHNTIKRLVLGIDNGEEQIRTRSPWIPTVPKNWEKYKLRNLMSETKELVGENSDQYTLLSLTTNGIIIRDLSEAKGKFPSDFSSYQIVKPGQFVFCLFDIDETPRTVGLSNLQGMITGAYTVFDVKKVDPNYLLQYFTVLDDEKALKPIYSGLRKVIKVNTLLNQDIYLPPDDEQKKIVNQVSEVLGEYERIENTFKKEIEVLTDLRKRIIASVVMGQLDVRDVIIPDYEYTEDDEIEEQED